MHLYVFNIELLNQFVICLNKRIYICVYTDLKSTEHFVYRHIFKSCYLRPDRTFNWCWILEIMKLF